MSIISQDDSSFLPYIKSNSSVNTYEFDESKSNMSRKSHELPAKHIKIDTEVSKTTSLPTHKLKPTVSAPNKLSFLTTYKHRYMPYNSEDVLLVGKCDGLSCLFSLRIESKGQIGRNIVMDATTTADALSRVYDGDKTYGCIISAVTSDDFIKRLREKPYVGVVIAYDNNRKVGDLDAFMMGFDGILRVLDRVTMHRIVELLQEVLCIQTYSSAMERVEQKDDAIASHLIPKTNTPEILRDVIAGSQNRSGQSPPNAHKTRLK
jgi:hypothetical protein